MGSHWSPTHGQHFQPNWGATRRHVKGLVADLESMREEYNPAESPPGDLPGIWRERAEFLKEYGDPSTGRLRQLAATELDAARVQ